jgi:3'-phosphoadenosine 5'-phosphosulfate sulfotransferase
MVWSSVLVDRPAWPRSVRVDLIADCLQLSGGRLALTIAFVASLPAARRAFDQLRPAVRANFVDG